MCRCCKMVLKVRATYQCSVLTLRI
uniref:Uncharacterized protein n=1 Tax=Anguilla anguilla TaxID=7936 RepID=A0A0E9Q0A6_ANGAN